MPPLTKANCAAFKKVVPTKGIVAKKPSHPSVMAPLLPCSEHRLTPAYFAVCAQPASSGSQSGQTADGGKSLQSSSNPSLALKALLETQARARAALAERHSRERTEFENACQRERSKLEAREAQSAAAGPEQEQRAPQQCVYCKQAFPSAAGGGAAVELCAGGCKAIHSTPANGQVRATTRRVFAQRAVWRESVNPYSCPRLLGIHGCMSGYIYAGHRM